MTHYAIALIPGDGIGPEIIPEAKDVLATAAALHDVELTFTTYPWGASHYLETGAFLPPDGLAQLARHDAILFGAVGRPEVDDRLPARDFTFRVRQAFRQYANVRPVRYLTGMPSPLKTVGDRPLDFVVVRENSEGEFVQAGNRIHRGAPEEVAVETSVFTRTGVARIAHFAFRLAQSRRGQLTAVTKSNTLIHSLDLWDEVIAEVAGTYPDVRYQRMYVDAVAANLVLRPERFDVLLSTNMMGDILSDLGAALLGSLGYGPSGNICPERDHPSMFEPIHGSAPDIAGQGIANPMAAIGSAAMMMAHLGEHDVAASIEHGLAGACAAGMHGRDTGGNASTHEIAAAVRAHLPTPTAR